MSERKMGIKLKSAKLISGVVILMKSGKKSGVKSLSVIRKKNGQINGLWILAQGTKKEKTGVTN